MISITTSLFQHFGELMRADLREVVYLKVLIAYIINKSPKMTKKFFNLGQMKSIDHEKLVIREATLNSLAHAETIHLLFRFQMNINPLAINFLRIRDKGHFQATRRWPSLDDSGPSLPRAPSTRFRDDLGLGWGVSKGDARSFVWSNFLLLFSKLLSQIEKMKMIKIGKEEVRVIYLVLSTPDMPFQMKLQAECILLTNKTFSRDFALSSLSLYRQKKFSGVFYRTQLPLFLQILIKSLKNKESALKCLKIIFLFLEDALEDNSLYSIIGQTNITFSSEENLSEDKNLILESLSSTDPPKPVNPAMAQQPSSLKSFLDPPDPAQDQPLLSIPERLFVQMIDVFMDSLHKKCENTPFAQKVKAQIYFNSCNVVRRLVTEKFAHRPIDKGARFPNLKRETEHAIRRLGHNVSSDATILKAIFAFPEILEIVDSPEIVQLLLDYRKRRPANEQCSIRSRP